MWDCKCRNGETCSICRHVPVVTTPEHDLAYWIKKITMYESYLEHAKNMHAIALERCNSKKQ